MQLVVSFVCRKIGFWGLLQQIGLEDRIDARNPSLRDSNALSSARFSVDKVEWESGDNCFFPV